MQDADIPSKVQLRLADGSEIPQYGRIKVDTLIEPCQDCSRLLTSAWYWH